MHNLSHTGDRHAGAPQTQTKTGAQTRPKARSKDCRRFALAGFAALVATVLAAAPAAARAPTSSDCKAFEAERASLSADGIAADMEKGPEWAQANLPADRLKQILRFIHITEQVKFRCPDVYAAEAVAALEERARRAAEAARLWAEKQAEWAKNPVLPERNPLERDLTAVALKPTVSPAAGQPPLPVRNTVPPLPIRSPR